jgi:hypothetical protein
MSQFAFISNIVRSLQTLQDHTPGSLLLLFKRLKNEPDSEKYEVLLFELKTGKREEYFKHFLEYPEFVNYFIQPKWDNYEIEKLKKDFNNLYTDNSGRKFTD